MKIAFVGGGNMASALIGGLLAKKTKPASLSVVEVMPEARKRLARKKIHASAEPDARTFAADTLVFAVKPQDMRAAALRVRDVVRGKLVVSIAAGIRLADLSRWLGGHRELIRCMPNTPALIGAGITGLFAFPGVGAAATKRAARILGAVGKTVWVKDEALLDPVTAVSASSPAYVFWFIEQLAAAGVSLGLSMETSRTLAVEAVLGSAMLAARSKESPATLRERVTSRGGTTEAALRVFEQEGLAERFKRAVEAASRRGTEMGEMLGKDT